MRRSLLVLVVVECAIAALAACSAFSGNNNSTPPADAGTDGAGPSQGQDSPSEQDGSMTDASVVNLCADFDATPTPTSGNVMCGTEQRNLNSDPQNCGGCGHVCVGENCDGTGHCIPEPLVTGIGYVTPLGLGDASIYYFQSGPNGTVFNSARTPGGFFDAATITAEVSDAETYPALSGITMDPTTIYANTYVNLESASVGATPSIFTLMESSGLSSVAKFITTDNTHVAYTDYASFHVRLKDGGPTADLADLPGALDITTTPDGRYIFFIARTDQEAGAPSDDGGSPIQRGTLYRWRSSDHDLAPTLHFNTPTTVNGGLRSNLAADDASVYFSDGDGSIWSLSVDADTTTLPTLLSPGNGREISELAVDSARVYFTVGPLNTYYFKLDSVSKCGGPDFVHFLDTATANPNYSFQATGILIDDVYIYWGAGDGVYRIAK